MSPSEPQTGSRSPRLVVVGAGIAGLAAAHRLVELAAGARGLSLTVLEAAPRAGGLVSTERSDGFVLEGGPDSFVADKPWAADLCRRLGLGDRLIPTEPAARRIYVWHRGALHPLPAGLFLFAPAKLPPLLGSRLFTWRGKLRALAEVFLRRGDLSRDESVAAFVRRRFGGEVLEKVAQPLLGGIYACDVEELSVEAALPRFREAERRSRSVLLALWRQPRPSESRSALLSLRGGMQEMVEALLRRLPEGAVRLADPARRVVRVAEGGWRVETRRAEYFADGLVIALPAPEAAGLVREAVPEAAAGLAEISYSSTAVVNLAYRREDIGHPLDGAGFVVPASEGEELIACSFSSSKFQGRCPAGWVLVRAFVTGGGGLGDEAAIASRIVAALRRILKVRGEPLFARTRSHPRSLPRYRVGHLERVRKIELALARAPALALAGSSLYGVGIADCVRSGEEAARRVWGAVAARPPVAGRYS